MPARTPEQIEKLLDALADGTADLATRLEKIESLLANGALVDDLPGRLKGIEQKLAEKGGDLAGRVVVVEQKLAGLKLASAAALEGGQQSAEALSSDHVFSPSRRGLPDYEDARAKLLKQKPGELVTVIHLGKKTDLNYDAGRELLRQAKLAA